MKNINIRGIGEGLHRDVKGCACKAGLTIQEWAKDALARQVDHELDKPDRMDAKVQHPSTPEPAPLPEAGHDCPNCGDPMVRNEKLRRWECAGCSFVGR